MCVCVYDAGKPVLVVNGAYRGTRAILEALDTANFCVSVRIDQVRWGSRIDDIILINVHYRDLPVED